MAWAVRWPAKRPSNTAVRTFIESFEEQTRERESPIERRLLHSIEDANRAVRDLSHQ